MSSSADHIASYQEAMRILRQARAAMMALVEQMEKVSQAFARWKEESEFAAEMSQDLTSHSPLGSVLGLPKEDAFAKAYPAWQEALAQVHSRWAHIPESDREGIEPPHKWRIGPGPAPN
jgi:hypothetical protein